MTFQVKIQRFFYRINFYKIVSVIVVAFLLTSWLCTNYYRYNFKILPVFNESTILNSVQQNIPDQIFQIPSVYEWQNVFPKILPLDSLNFARLCLRNNSSSYFKGKKIGESEIASNVKTNNGLLRVTLKYPDGSYHALEVAQGHYDCITIDLKNLKGADMSMQALALTSNFGDISEVHTDNTELYLWPGGRNELIIFLILFLVISGLMKYLYELVSFFLK